MGKVTILEVTKNPITKMGQYAGICWGTDTTDAIKNYKRGLDCLESGHNRVLEVVNIEIAIEGYSARFGREWYTHIGCLPTRLQSSTRYVDYRNFEYVVPHTIEKNDEAKALYNNLMINTRLGLERLEKLGIPREDCAYALPLGMTTVIADKRNLRNLIDMHHTRLCVRTLWEFREMLQDLDRQLTDVSDEWEYIVKNYFVPKCQVCGFCTEKHGCGKYPRKENNNG